MEIAALVLLFLLVIAVNRVANRVVALNNNLVYLGEAQVKALRVLADRLEKS